MHRPLCLSVAGVIELGKLGNVGRKRRWEGKKAKKEDEEEEDEEEEDDERLCKNMTTC